MMGLFMALGLIECEIKHIIVCGDRRIRYKIKKVRLSLPEAIEIDNMVEEDNKYREILQIVKDSIIDIE